MGVIIVWPPLEAFMEITKKELTKRLQVLQNQRANAVITANACEGAIQTIQSLIDFLDKEKEDAVSEQKA